MKLVYLLLFSCFILGDQYEIKTSSGVVYGNKVANIISWEDIPYALPPVGELRWKAPREIDLSI